MVSRGSRRRKRRGERDSNKKKPTTYKQGKEYPGNSPDANTNQPS
jgi:hypothetical protein